MLPNETREWTVEGKTYKLIRTHRPYEYDLADCYNAVRSQAVIDKGGVWKVMPGGGIALVQTRAWTEDYTKRLEDAREAERERWKYLQEHPFAEQVEMFDSPPEGD